MRTTVEAQHAVMHNNTSQEFRTMKGTGACGSCGSQLLMRLSLLLATAGIENLQLRLLSLYSLLGTLTAN